MRLIPPSSHPFDLRKGRFPAVFFKLKLLPFYYKIFPFSAANNDGHGTVYMAYPRTLLKRLNWVSTIINFYFIPSFLAPRTRLAVLMSFFVPRRILIIIIFLLLLFHFLTPKLPNKRRRSTQKYFKCCKTPFLLLWCAFKGCLNHILLNAYQASHMRTRVYSNRASRQKMFKTTLVSRRFKIVIYFYNYYAEKIAL